MSNGSNPYVTRITIRDGKVMLTVQVNEFLPGDSVEISGYAIQDGNAFARFNAIKSVHENADGTANMYVEATPSQGFKSGVPVTVVLKAARAWVSVLTGPAGLNKGDTAAADGTYWDYVETVGQVTGGSWPTGKSGQAPATDASFPPT